MPKMSQINEYSDKDSRNYLNLDCGTQGTLGNTPCRQRKADMMIYGIAQGEIKISTDQVRPLLVTTNHDSISSSCEHLRSSNK